MKHLTRKEKVRRKNEKEAQKINNQKDANLVFIIIILVFLALFQTVKLSGCKMPKRKRRFSIEYHSPNIFRGFLI